MHQYRQNSYNPRKAFQGQRVRCLESWGSSLKGPLCKIQYHLVVKKNYNLNNLNVNPCFLTAHLNSHLSYTSCDDVLDCRYCLPLYKWTSFICNHKCILTALEIHLFVFSDFIYLNTRVYFLFHLTPIDPFTVLHIGPLKSVCALLQITRGWRQSFQVLLLGLSRFLCLSFTAGGTYRDNMLICVALNRGQIKFHSGSVENSWLRNMICKNRMY